MFQLQFHLTYKTAIARQRKVVKLYLEQHRGRRHSRVDRVHQNTSTLRSSKSGSQHHLATRNTSRMPVAGVEHPTPKEKTQNEYSRRAGS